MAFFHFQEQKIAYQLQLNESDKQYAVENGHRLCENLLITFSYNYLIVMINRSKPYPQIIHTFAILISRLIFIGKHNVWLY